MFALFHPPASSHRDIAVLICSPFGWEDMCSYRSRREWAQRLADAGYPVLRFDLPGTGDSSGSPVDPGRLEAWSTAVDSATRWLRGTTGARRIAAIGIGLGGLLAYRAAAVGAPLDDLVLWGVPARGRTLARELRAFSGMETGQLDGAVDGIGDPPPAPDGGLAVAGYVLSAETLADLGAVDLAVLPLSGAAARRVLLLERDGRDVDPRLRTALEQAGASVTVGAGHGYAPMMMAEPQESLPALETLDRVMGWLGAPAGTPAPVEPDPSAPEAHDAVELTVAGIAIRETPLVLEHPFGRPFGVLAEPVGRSGGLCLVLLNAGPQRRTGPNRMWVELARRWAARGVPALRLDLAGIGDAEGDGTRFIDPRAFYLTEYLDQVRVALDALESRGLPPRFVFGGLCVGGYWSVQMALRDDRAVAALMLNPGALVYDGGWDRTLREVRVLGQKLFRASTWRRVVLGETTFSVHLRTAWALIAGLALAPLRLPARLVRDRRERHEGGDQVDRALDQLRDGGKRATMVFAGDEPLHAQLERDGRLARLSRWPNVFVHHLMPTDSVHTMRPLRLQQRVHRLIDEAIERELAELEPDPDA